MANSEERFKMSNIRCINFYDLCRICTASSEQKTNIFSAEGKSKQLTTKIADCLALVIEEKDRLPKVICGQCVQHVENMYEFRNICRNSQSMLNSCLNTATRQSGEKVYIKDAVSGSGKSLSVLSSKSSGRNHFPTLVPTSVDGTITLQTPAVGTNSSSSVTTMQNTLQQNDLLNSLMQAVGGLQPQTSMMTHCTPQYTITVDSKSDSNQRQPTEFKIEAVPPVATVLTQKQQDVIKDEKHTVIEKFIKLKPDLKITPLGKRDTTKSSHQQQLIHSLQQRPTPTIAQIQIQQTANDQQQQLQQLQQLQQHLQQQWQQQQLQQQLQQLTTQLQAQPQITFSSPTSLTTTLPSTQQQQEGITTSSAQPLSPKNKKPKLNFVLSSPTTQTMFATSLPHLTNTVTASTQPQIHLQLQPSSLPQQSHQISTANLLSNLASHATTTDLHSPNKCFLPITIRDEHSEQQIVAHIDAKNFVLPTTYQVQMKLQSQLATTDGQPIIQLTPTSIPATLQLTPQALTNSTFQSDPSDNVSIEPSKSPQQQSQQQQPLMTPQKQSFPIEQQRQQLQSTAQVTSQQLITPPRNLIPTNTSQYKESITSVVNDDIVFKTPQRQIKQEKYKSSQLSGANIIKITPTTNFTQQIMEQVKQQQLQKQHAKQIETTVTSMAMTSTTGSFSQQTGITVQRVQPKTSSLTQHPTSPTRTMTTTADASESESNVKLPVFKKQNITISRVTMQSQQTQQYKPQQQIIQKQTLPPPTQQKAKLLPTQPYQKQNQRQQQQQQKQVKSLIVEAISSTVQVKTQTPTPTSAIKKVSHRPPPKLVQTVTIPAQNVTHMAPVITSATSGITAPTIVSQENTSSATGNESTNAAPGPTSANSTPFTCETCGRAFKKKEHLTQHTKLHAGLRPFKCTEDICNKAFSRKEHLLRHLVSHTGKKMFSCDVCQKPFSRKDNLNKHRRVHNTHSPESFYKCEFCDKNFAVKSYFEKHKEMHKKTPDVEKAAKENEAQAKPIATIQKTLQHQQPEKTEKQLTPHVQIISPQPQQLMPQRQQQQQIMHVQLQPHVVTTQDLAGNTITITQASDQAISPSIANFMQLNLSQFQNAATSNQLVCKLEK